MSETVGEVMRRLFGVYDYVYFKKKSCEIYKGSQRVPEGLESRKFKSYRIVDGMEMSKKIDVPSAPPPRRGDSGFRCPAEAPAGCVYRCRTLLRTCASSGRCPRGN